MDAASTLSAVSQAPRVTFATPPASTVGADLSGTKKLVKKPAGKLRSGNGFMLALVGIMFGLAIMYLVTRLISVTRKMAALEKQLKQQRSLDGGTISTQPASLPSGRAPLPLDVIMGGCAPPPKVNLPASIPLPRNIPLPSKVPHVQQPLPVPTPTQQLQQPQQLQHDQQPPHAQEPSSKEMCTAEDTMCFASMPNLQGMPFPFPFPPGMMVMVDMPDLPDADIDFASLFGMPPGLKPEGKPRTPPRVEEVVDELKEEKKDGTESPTKDVQTMVDHALAPLGDVMTALENMSKGKSGDESGSDSDENSSDDATPRRSTRGRGGAGGRTATTGGRGRGRGRRSAAEK